MNFKLGTIVSLKSNGLLSLASNQHLSLGGDENFTVPLMVIVEAVFSTQSEIDELTGEIKFELKGKNKYKCVYFSNKSMRLEENWFTENELEIYGELENQIHQTEKFENIKWGDIVRFKTIDEEAKKTKSYNEGIASKKVKPLLTYSSPALQVIGFANVEKKEPLIDPYNGLKKREISKKFLKCKFFNPITDKFSEFLFPIECLQKIDNSKSKEYIEKISQCISSKELLIIELKDKKYFGTIQSLHVYSGRYQIIIYNELLKKNEIIWIDLITNFIKIDLIESKYYPGVHKLKGKDEVIDVVKYIEINNKKIKGNYFKIVYRNLKEEIVSRYISIKEVSILFGGNYYLKSFCFYRNAEREFRSDRILSIRTIEDKNLNDFLKGNFF